MSLEETDNWTMYKSLIGENELTVLVFEKIDGANAALIESDGEVLFASRSRKITKGDKFHGFQTMKTHRGEDFASLKLPKGCVIYGEVFGGYDGPDKKKAPVQTRIKYGLTKRFVVFDIMMDTHPIPYRDRINLCAELGLDYLKPVYTGTLVNACAWAQANLETFKSEYAEDDLAEGFVLHIDKERHKYRREVYRQPAVREVKC